MSSHQTALPISLDPETVKLAHQLDTFANTRHGYSKDFHQHTINLVGYVVTFYPFSQEPDIPSAWPVDRSAVHNAVKNFHTLTISLRNDPHYRTWEDQFLSTLTSFSFPSRALGFPRSRTPESDNPRVSEILPEQSQSATSQKGKKSALRATSRPRSRGPSRGPQQSSGHHSHSISEVTEEIQRVELADIMDSPSENASFTPAQKECLEAMMHRVIQSSLHATPQSPGPQGPQGPQGPPGPPGPAGDGNNHSNALASWRPDELGFFDPDLQDDAVVGKGDIVYLGNHPYYRNVFVFVDRIKDVAQAKGNQTVRLNLHSCLRGTALEWHASELTTFEKDMLRTVELENGWIKLLIARFKERPTIALSKMERDKYTLRDAASGRTPRAYAQGVFRNAQAAGMSSTLNQLAIAWNHLHWEFQRDIPEPTDSISKAEFLSLLEAKTDIWRSLATSRLRTQSFSSQESSNTYFTPNRNMRDSRGRGRGIQYNYPSRFLHSRNYSPSTVQRPMDNYRYQNHDTANYPWNSHPQASGSSQLKTTYNNPPQRQLPAPHQQLLLPAPHDKKEEHQNQPSNSQPWNRSTRSWNRNQSQWPHQKAFQADVQESDQSRLQNTPEPLEITQESRPSFNSEQFISPEYEYPQDCYVADLDSEFPNQEYYEEPYEDYGGTDAFFTQTVSFECLHCAVEFDSHNKLHHHIRQEHPFDHTSSNYKQPETAVPNIYFSPIEVESTISSSEPEPEIILSTATDDPVPGYGFRYWHYITAQCYLVTRNEAEPVCLDTGCTMSLVNKQWLHKQGFPIDQIRTLPAPITVKGIGGVKHSSSEYATI